MIRAAVPMKLRKPLKGLSSAETNGETFNIRSTYNLPEALTWGSQCHNDWEPAAGVASQFTGVLEQVYNVKGQQVSGKTVTAVPVFP